MTPARRLTDRAADPLLTLAHNVTDHTVMDRRAGIRARLVVLVLNTVMVLGVIVHLVLRAYG